ncbi:MAG: WbuC family cupin fold metalloprotein [Anaeroplasmataceae bacterium]|nr:WbuC family cupin fold metalloprotein [Anaeroplasmataceae bacterium]
MYRPGGKDYLYVNDNSALKINKEYIEQLKILAQKNSLKKSKMCLHNDIRKHVHEMINVFPEGAYVRPHFHPLKTETQVIIEGKMLMIVFDGAGKIVDNFIMEKDGIFMFRLEKGMIHTNIPLSDVVIYEVTDGPFLGKDDSVFPEWASETEYGDEIKKLINMARQ